MKETEIQTRKKNSSMKLFVLLYQCKKLSAGNRVIKWSSFRCRCHSMVLHNITTATFLTLLTATFLTLSDKNIRVLFF